MLLFFSYQLVATNLSKSNIKKIAIASISYKGNGCPEKSIFVDISPDKEVFTTSFNQFIVTKNGAAEPFGQTKTCTLSVTLKKPKGIGFHLFSLDLEGAGDLQENILAQQKISIKTLGRPYKDPKRQISLTGPYSGNYERTEDFDLINRPWLSCYQGKAKLTIRTQISIHPHPEKRNNNYGFMSLDQTEGVLKEKIGLIWTNCDKKQRTNPYFSFCRLKIFHSKKNKLMKSKITRARGKSQKESYDKALNKAEKLCNNATAKENRFCLIEKTKCKTQKLF